MTLLKHPGPNNGDEDAKTIAAGQKVNGTFTTGDLDVYDYEGTNGETITVLMGRETNLGGYTTVFDVYGPDGSLLATAPNLGVSALLQRFRLTNSGTYQIVCRDGDGIANGTASYGLSLIRTPGPNLSDAGESNRIYPGQTVTGTSSPGDLDVYDYEGTAGETLAILLADLSASVTLSLDLYGPTGALLVTQTNYPANFVQALRLTNSGTYQIVSRYSLSFASGGYQMTLIRSPGSNDADEDRGSISNGQTRTGSLAIGDLDAVTFVAVIGDSITIDMRRIGTSSGLAPAIDLYDPDGGLLATTSGTPNVPAQLHLDCLAVSGTYLIVCRDSGGDSSGNYSLSLSQSPGPPPFGSPAEYLQIGTCSNHVIVRWSTNALGFRLQSTEDLPTSNWLNIPQPYPASGGYYFVTNDIPPLSRFYRLIKP
jgi:hypothetical protein